MNNVNQFNRNDKLRIYYDAEFTGLHRKTTLISIGLVSDSGKTFYAEFSDFDQAQVNDWINDNVIRNLSLDDDDDGTLATDHLSGGKANDGAYNVRLKGSSDDIQEQLIDWLLTEYTVSQKQIQFFTDCYAYDWILMNDLICDFGDALNIPKHINYIPIDLSTLLWTINIDPDISREKLAGDFTPPGGMEVRKHNSLWDAYVCKACFEKILGGITVNYN